MKKLTIIVLTLSIIMSIIVGCVGKPATNNYEKDCEIESVEIPDTFMATTEQKEELNKTLENLAQTTEETTEADTEVKAEDESTTEATSEEPAQITSEATSQIETTSEAAVSTQTTESKPQPTSETSNNTVAPSERPTEDTQKAKAEAEKKAQEEAERKAREEAERKAEEERKAQEEAERIAKEEAERKAEEERKAQEEAERKAREEAEAQKASIPQGNTVSFKRIISKKFDQVSADNIITVDQLEPRLQDYARQILDIILNSNEDRVSVDWFNSYDEFNTVMNAINYTYFYYESRIIYEYNGFGDTPEYIIDVTRSRAEYNLGLTQYNYINNATNSCVYSGMCEKDAVIAINNYVCNLLSYDPAVKARTIDDAFATHLGICDTYATIVKAMCNNVGIECEYFSGPDHGYNIDHAWNRVKIGNSWYWLDACWNDDDPTPDYLLSTELWANHNP